ncbi:MAG TPA: AbrB/MazE/SpoVT family DNA-binding domain-containing protein [Thermodesulfobacteriota bacterium]|jgi:AbrB family looped-hinge helix DNA binding protein
MRVTAKGQVTIPQAIREQVGLLPDTEVQFEVVGDVVQIRKVRGARTRGRAIVDRLRGKATAGLTTDEIMALTRGEP